MSRPRSCHVLLHGRFAKPASASNLSRICPSRGGSVRLAVGHQVLPNRPRWSAAPAHLLERRSVDSMELHPTSFEVGPENARLLVRTHRGGLGARAGHDLVIEATRWAGQVSIDAGEPPGGHVEVRVDTHGLEVREGHGGARPLTDKDRLEIKSNIEEKVLNADRYPELRFTAEKVAVEDHDAHLIGNLTIGGQTRPTGVDVDLEPAADGLHAHGTVQLRQTDFGIKPYSALMGMLKVADEVEVDFDVRLPSGAISP